MTTEEVTPAGGDPTRDGPVRPDAVLVVDAANVVGCVPDGWWRDRAGATARLHAGLVAGVPGVDRVVLVVEGRARDGVPPGVVGAVRTVHAPGSGDDTIVACVRQERAAGHDVAVATADRGLLARLPREVVVRGPREVRLLRPG